MSKDQIWVEYLMKALICKKKTKKPSMFMDELLGEPLNFS